MQSVIPALLTNRDFARGSRDGVWKGRLLLSQHPPFCPNQVPHVKCHDRLPLGVGELRTPRIQGACTLQRVALSWCAHEPTLRPWCPAGWCCPGREDPECPWCAPYFLSLFSGPHPQHMEVPRLGGELELQQPAYTTATATRDLRHICDLHHSSWQRQFLNPPSEARDRTWILRGTSQVLNPLSHNRNSTTSPLKSMNLTFNKEQNPNNKDPLYSTGNSIQYPVINHSGKEYGKEGI